MIDTHAAGGSTLPLAPDSAVELERQLAVWRTEAVQKLPTRGRTLAAIVRRPVDPQGLRKLERWCRKHDIHIEHRWLPRFRDYLITQLIELKDLEPEARARLREHWLANQDARLMTEDYADGFLSGSDMRCRDCRWFVRAPKDGEAGDGDQDKSCVSLGTKGADIACYGFQRQ